MASLSIEQRVIDLLTKDSVLAPLYSDVPDCGLSPYQKSDTLQVVTITLFLRDTVATRQHLGVVCKHVVELLRSLLSEYGLKGIRLWVKAESSRDMFKRLLKLNVAEQGYDKLRLLPLPDLLNEEYVEDDGVQIMRYAPISSA